MLAQRHNIPFMVVAPVTTIDLSLSTGKEYAAIQSALPEVIRADTVRIHIEQRPPIEATQVRGRNVETGEMAVVRITPEGVGEGKELWQQVYNPSFDVTPSELISESTRSRRAVQVERASSEGADHSGCVVTEKGVAERKQGEKSIDVASVC